MDIVKFSVKSEYSQVILAVAKHNILEETSCSHHTIVPYCNTDIRINFLLGKTSGVMPEVSGLIVREHFSHQVVTSPRIMYASYK